MNNCLAGFHGQRADPVSATTPLGNGYRNYHPILQRFTAPDSFSPFGAGGVNSYTYCANDPVNKSDPSGHMSPQAWLGIGMGIIGLGLAIFSAGASIAAAGGVMAAVESASTVSLVTGAAGIVSDVAAIASGALEGGQTPVSVISGWISLGAGFIGIAQGVRSLAGLLKGATKRPFGALMAGGQVATGQFRSPRFLGASTGVIPGFDYVFEDTSSIGARRLNIITHEELRYGNNPTLGINLWNDELGVNLLRQYSPHSGTPAELMPYFLDENGGRYQVYRFGISRAALTRGLNNTAHGSNPRSFARTFSLQHPRSLVEVSRHDVVLSGPAYQDVRYAVAYTHHNGAIASGLDGQEIMHLVNEHWGEVAGAFEMASDEWVTYQNGRILDFA